MAGQETEQPMARTDERFREAHNRLLGLCEGLSPGDPLPSELVLAERLDVSRTVVRVVLQRLSAVGIIVWDGRHKALLRAPLPSDRLAAQPGPISAEELERQFLDWVLRFDVAPGTALNVSELARRFGVSAHVLQEFLASLSRFGLVRRRAKGGWALIGFTRDFAVELSEFRLMLELNAVRHVLSLAADDPFWGALDDLEAQHIALATEIDARFHDFSLLDKAFHTTLCGTLQNRFVAEFQKLIALIFHYHFQWDKSDERLRNAAAIGEHLRIIRALKMRDREGAMAAAEDHLKTSKLTLLNSLRDHRMG